MRAADCKRSWACRAAGYKVQTEDLVNVLLGVAAQGGTLEAVCADWAAGAHPESIRRYLNQQLQVAQLPALEARLNEALAGQIPARLWQQAQPVAIDLHDEPYYGKQSQGEGRWVRGRRQQGTSRFYRVATAYVMVKHLRVTLAIHFVQPDEETVTVLQTLLERLVHVQVVRGRREGVGVAGPAGRRGSRAPSRAAWPRWRRPRD